MIYKIKFIEPCGGTEIIEINIDSLQDAIQYAKKELKKWIKNGEYGNKGAIITGWWEIENTEEYGSIDVEIKPNINELILEIGGDITCNHIWSSKNEGGCSQNPGVFSHGGTGLSIYTHCKLCGIKRKDYFTGYQKNEGEHSTVEFELPC